MIRINRLAYPITVLGYGSRIALWVQGCNLQCPGCSSIDTWDENGGELIDIGELASTIAGIVREHDLDGLTITGGEPTNQADALARLVGHVERRLDPAGEDGFCKPFDVLVFSGREERVVREGFPSLWNCADALVCGPYDENDPSDAWLVATGNQRLACRTELGKERYGHGRAGKRGIQFTISDGDITFAGITRTGDLALIEKALLNRGITLGANTWTNR